MTEKTRREFMVSSDWMKSTEERPPAPGIDMTVPHSARVWNYWLGGKDNFAIDREVGDQFRANFPAIVDNAKAFRRFLNRAVHFLAGEANVRQFLDIGTGLPTADNTHEVAQRVAPDSKIVYVDNDPLVLTHARALLTSTSRGATDYIDADLRDTEEVIGAAKRTLDFAQPIALIMSGILGHFDGKEAREVVARLLVDLAPGSFLVICDGTDTSEAQTRYSVSTTNRTRMVVSFTTSEAQSGSQDSLMVLNWLSPA